MLFERLNPITGEIAPRAMAMAMAMGAGDLAAIDVQSGHYPI